MIMFTCLFPLTASGAVTALPEHKTTLGQMEVTTYAHGQQMTQSPTSIPTPPTSTMPLGQSTANPAIRAEMAATPNSTTSSSSTEGPTLMPMSTTVQSTRSLRATTRFTSPTQNQSTRMTTPVAPSGNITHPSTTGISTMSASPGPSENETTTLQATTSKARLTTSMDHTSTTKKPVVRTTKKKQGPPPKKQEVKQGKIVAGLIGGALVLMMVGFLVIYIKKRKLHKQQIMTSDWAGPTPFLDGGTDNGPVTLRSSNRISISSFLPQRLSKRLSLLPEVGEEMEDMTPGSTFGDKVTNQEKSSKDAPVDVVNSNNSPQVDNPLFINEEVEKSKQDQSKKPATPSEKVKDPPAEPKDEVAPP